MIEGADTVLTFDPHPLQVIHPEAAPKLIMPFEVKRDVIDGLGVDELVVIPFDEDFSEIDAEGFIEQVLVDRLGATQVSVGENFRFGAKAKGDPEMLAARDEFETTVVPLVEVDGETVSSTRIRALVAAGDMPRRSAASGRRSCSRARSSTATGAGATLGFPTANVVPDDSLVIPGHGIYAGFANGHPAAVNVGISPTFDTGRGVLIETHRDRLRGGPLRASS